MQTMTKAGKGLQSRAMSDEWKMSSYRLPPGLHDRLLAWCNKKWPNVQEAAAAALTHWLETTDLSDDQRTEQCGIIREMATGGGKPDEGADIDPETARHGVRQQNPPKKRKNNDRAV